MVAAPADGFYIASNGLCIFFVKAMVPFEIRECKSMDVKPA
jgi:hypothetical protein